MRVERDRKHQASSTLQLNGLESLMGEFRSEAREVIIAKIAERCGPETAELAAASHDSMVEALREELTPLMVMARVADMLHLGMNAYATLIEDAFNNGDLMAFQGGMLGLTASVHFVASAIDIRVAEFTDAELFAGVEWDEAVEGGDVEGGESDA